MSRTPITVHELMQLVSPSAHTIEAQRPIAEASKQMQRAGLERLPVTSGSQLIGLLDGSIVPLAEVMGHGQRLCVGDAMRREPYVVDVSADLLAVITSMAERRLDAAIVVNRNEVVGTFTAADALHLLVRHLGIQALRQLPPAPRSG